MRKTLNMGIVISVLSILLLSSMAYAEVVDRIVATVDGEIITMQDVEGRVAVILKQKPTTDKAAIRTLKRRVLKSLIEAKLVQQELARLENSVTDREVEKAIENVRLRSSMTQEEFEQDLKTMGMTLEMFQGDVRSQLAKMKLIRSEISPRIIISDEQIKKYYDDNPEKFQVGNKVSLRNIVFLLPPGASEVEVKEKIDYAEKVTTGIKSPRNFARVAIRYSEGGNAKKGGEMGLIAANDLSSVIKEALKDLKDGEITKPLKLGNTVQIIQLVERFGQGNGLNGRAKRKIKEFLMNNEVMNKYARRMNEVKDKTVIEIKK